MNVVIADRREFDRLALRALCETGGDLWVVATVERTIDAELAITENDCDALLLGRSLLRTGGPEVVDRLRAVRPDCRIILVGVGEEQHLRLDALRVGADAVLRRDGEIREQLSAIRGTSGTVPRWVGYSPPSRSSP